MLNWVASASLVIGFIVVARAFRMVDSAKQVIGLSRRTLTVLRDAEASDDDKEKAAQVAARQVIGLFFLLLIGGAAAFLLPLGFVWVCDRIGLLSFDAVLEVALSPTFLIGSTVLVCGGAWLFARPKDGGYSRLDRLLHRIAFGASNELVGLADLEDRLYGKRLATRDVERPVFITALPRAGTTLLLECCAKMPDLASHTYRDMPFTLVPCLWNSISSRFRETGERRERAHGDGMLIDFDSPEALEEMVWMRFWRGQYLADRIAPWGETRDEEFEQFFRSHMRKIVYLRAPDAEGVRYLSKANMNIARTALLRAVFPKSVILVPFRNPGQHAASLLQQHLRFLQVHAGGSFASTYMRGMGHFDFGENLRPIDFGGWFDARETKDAQELGYWIEYWIATYGQLLARNDGLTFIGYESLCEDPKRVLGRIADTISCRNRDALVEAARTIRVPRARNVDTTGVPATVLARARAIHACLEDVALA